MYVSMLKADGCVTYAGDGVVEERVLLLERFEILCRDGLVHVDLCRSRIGSCSTHPITRSAFRPFCVCNIVDDGVHCFLVLSMGTHFSLCLRLDKTLCYFVCLRSFVRYFRMNGSVLSALVSSTFDREA